MKSEKYSAYGYPQIELELRMLFLLFTLRSDIESASFCSNLGFLSLSAAAIGNLQIKVPAGITAPFGTTTTPSRMQ